MCSEIFCGIFDSGKLQGCGIMQRFGGSRVSAIVLVSINSSSLDSAVVDDAAFNYEEGVHVLE